MIDRKNVVIALEKCAGGECNGKCPYNGINYGCRPKLMLDALELLKEQETELQIASTGGFHEGYAQAMREMPEEIKHMTNEEKFDLRNIREIRKGNKIYLHIINGNYVVMRRDIYDRYREKVGELG